MLRAMQGGHPSKPFSLSGREVICRADLQCLPVLPKTLSFILLVFVVRTAKQSTSKEDTRVML